MTDITGNFSVNNQNNYIKEARVQNGACPDCGRMHEEEPQSQINLDKSSAAQAGRAMIKTSKVEGKKPYKFEKKNVEEDVLAFQILADAANTVKQVYIQKGFAEQEAEAKARDFVDAMLDQAIAV